MGGCLIFSVNIVCNNRQEKDFMQNGVCPKCNSRIIIKNKPLLTKGDYDGIKQGFCCDLIRLLSESVRIPVVASGGAGSKEHFLEVFENGKADAALAASIFHFGTVVVRELKEFLVKNSVPIRLC